MLENYPRTSIPAIRLIRRQVLAGPIGGSLINSAAKAVSKGAAFLSIQAWRRIRASIANGRAMAGDIDVSLSAYYPVGFKSVWVPSSAEEEAPLCSEMEQWSLERGGMPHLDNPVEEVHFNLTTSRATSMTIQSVRAVFYRIVQEGGKVTKCIEDGEFGGGGQVGFYRAAMGKGWTGENRSTAKLYKIFSDGDQWDASDGPLVHSEVNGSSLHGVLEIDVKSTGTYYWYLEVDALVNGKIITVATKNRRAWNCKDRPLVFKYGM